MFKKSNKDERKYFHILNDILKYVLNNSADDVFLRRIINDDSLFQNIPANVRFALVYKLQADKYLAINTWFENGSDPEDTIEDLVVTFEGTLFLESNGYVGKFERENSEKRLNKNIAILVMIGTVGAMLFSGISLYISFRNNNNEKTIVIEVPMKTDSTIISR